MKKFPESEDRAFLLSKSKKDFKKFLEKNSSFYEIVKTANFYLTNFYRRMTQSRNYMK